MSHAFRAAVEEAASSPAKMFVVRDIPVSQNPQFAQDGEEFQRWSATQVYTEIEKTLVPASMQWRIPEAANSNQAKTEIQPYPGWHPSIADLGYHWRLNKRQYYVLLMVAWSILRTKARRLLLSNDLVTHAVIEKIDGLVQSLNTHMYKDRSDLEVVKFPKLTELHESTTIRMDLIGGAGFGKSHLTDAILDFERAWLVVGCCVNTSTTGSNAACNMGVTFYKALGANLNFQLGGAKKLEAKKECWMPVGLFTIDEAGRMKPKDDWGTEMCMRILKSSSNFYGDTDTLFSYDILQPGSGGKTKFSTKGHTEDPHWEQEEYGVLLHRHRANATVELDQPIRSFDPILSKISKAFATNQLTKEDIAVYNKRLIDLSRLVEVLLGGVMSTHSNAESQACNYALVQQFTVENPFSETDQIAQRGWRSRGLLLILGTFDGTMTDKQLAKLYSLSPNMTRGSSNKRDNDMLGTATCVSTQLFFVRGFPYRAHTNEHVDRGVANGTVAIAKEVIFNVNVLEEDVVFFKKDSEWGGGVHCVHAEHVQGLVFEHLHKGWKKRHFCPQESTGKEDEEGNVAYEAQQSDKAKSVSGLPVGHFPMT